MNFANNTRSKNKSRSSYPKRKTTYATTFEKSATFRIESLKNFRDVLQAAKIPMIFVKQVGSMINSYSANSAISENINVSISTKNPKGYINFYSNSDLNFLSFQKSLANYLANSGINRFSRDFDFKIKTISQNLKKLAPDISREISELNVYNKSDFVHRFSKIKRKFFNNYNNFSTNSSKMVENRNNMLSNRNTTSVNKRNKEKESNYENVIELFNQIDSQICSNDIVLKALSQINTQINMNSFSSSSNNSNDNKTEQLNDSKDNKSNSFICSDILSEYSTLDYSSPFDPKNNNKNNTYKTQKNRNVNSKSSSTSEDEIFILKSKKLALQAILELQTKHTDLRDEVNRLSQTVDRSQLLRNLVNIDKEILYSLQEEIENLNLVNDSLIKSSLIEKEDNIACFDSTVDFSNMKMSADIGKLESKIKNFGHDLYYLNKKPIENSYMLKKTKRLMKKRFDKLSNRPQPPIIQKYQNNKLQKKIHFFQEENDKITIDRTVFDEFEILSLRAKKCQTDFYNLKDNLDSLFGKTRMFSKGENDLCVNSDHILSDDDNYEKVRQNVNSRSEVLQKMDDLNDDYTYYTNQIDSIIGRQNQELLWQKRRALNRQRRRVNRLLTAAFECGEELKENLEIEDEVREEAVQRGIVKSDILSSCLFDAMQRREMARTIDEKCREIMRDDEKLKVDVEANNGVLALETAVRAALGSKKCAQLERIACLKRQVEEMKSGL